MKDLMPRACVVVKTTATATKASFENKHLENGDHFVIASPSHPLLPTGHAANGLVKTPLK